MSDTRTQVPAVEGLFTMDLDEPHLIGARGVSQPSYFFPKDLAGSDPGCLGDELEEVLLSRTGQVVVIHDVGLPTSGALCDPIRTL